MVGDINIPFKEEDRLFKIRIVERLERIEKEMKRKNPVSSTLNLNEEISEEEFEHLVLSILIGILGQFDEKQFLNRQDQDGFTLLHYFCGLGYLHLARTVLRCGARRDIVDRWGNVPCQLAMKYGHPELVKLLMDSSPLENSIERIAEEFETLGLQSKIDAYQKASEDQEVLQKAASKIQHAYRRHKAVLDKVAELKFY